MRPRLIDKEKRTIVVKLLMTPEEKLRLDSWVKRGKYACRSDYMRSRIFRTVDRKQISLDAETTEQLKSLDFELNKIGVNLNQLSKRMNSFSGYRMSDQDRHLLRQAFDQMRDCLLILQKHLR
ncbi:plasmid mobilization relaxosome protein MobC [uncultured Sunxiuqinia sp.]|uniref:plasmid mobilization relaxosome protein MobC n=1 Tax=uncultured Sunxiuqinia sp. TaxID=1573825 RepID=UPI0026338DFB|nr:plasmid mobilization relaxosome protein MobC [uncultured Sunxiuqinia sp.]